MNRKIILGTVQFGLNYGINNTGGKPSEESVHEILEYAGQQGVKIIDTADAYGNATELLGIFNQKHPDVFLINTKFRNSGNSLSDQLQDSLRKLRIQKVHTYFFHSYEDFIRYPDLLLELNKLKKVLKFEKIGLSVYDNQEFRSAIKNKEIEVIQLPFNLLDNFSKRGDLLKEAKDKGKEIQVRSVFLQGLFFKPLNMIPSKLGKLIPYLQQINEIASINNLTVEQLALQYALSQPEIDHVIIGIDNLEQLKRNLAFTQQILPGPTLQSINKILVKETELLYPKNWN
jgi:aryl-alcohol dehydrogenase-like predicted oxidoreductase